MASAATEAEKGSPAVVGLLVVGNIIILVRPPPVPGSPVGGWGGGDSPGPGVGAEGPLPWPMPPAVESEQPGFESQLCQSPPLCKREQATLLL